MSAGYEFQIDGLSDLDRASLEEKLPANAIVSKPRSGDNRHGNLVDSSVLIDIAQSAIPALAAWLATRRVALKVTRKKKSGDSWSFDFGMGADDSRKSPDAIATILERD